MDDWRDDGDVVWLRNEIRSRDDVEVKLLSGTRLPQGFVQKLSTQKCGEQSSIRALSRSEGGLKMGFNSLLHFRNRHSHVLGKSCARLVELHDSACRVMPAVPGECQSGAALLRARRKWRCVLPPLSSHVVSPSRLIGKTSAVRVKDETSDTAERFSCKELDLGIGVVGIHQAC